jgi:hypothetical protein
MIFSQQKLRSRAETLLLEVKNEEAALEAIIARIDSSKVSNANNIVNNNNNKIKRNDNINARTQSRLPDANTTIDKRPVDKVIISASKTSSDSQPQENNAKIGQIGKHPDHPILFLSDEEFANTPVNELMAWYYY